MVERKKRLPYFKGLLAESLVCRILSFSEYTLLEHRFNTVFTEIDIIAMNYNIRSLKFIEVKYRKIFRSFSETISYNQIEKLKLASECVIQTNFFDYHDLDSTIEIWFVNEKEINVFSI